MIQFSKSSEIISVLIQLITDLRAKYKIYLYILYTRQKVENTKCDQKIRWNVKNIYSSIFILSLWKYLQKLLFEWNMLKICANIRYTYIFKVFVDMTAMFRAHLACKNMCRRNPLLGMRSYVVFTMQNIVRKIYIETRINIDCTTCS